METICLQTTSNEEPAEEKDDQIMSMLFLKDKYEVSHTAYHEMVKACKELPREHRLQKKINDLNQRWSIEPMSNDIVGVQQRLEPRLRERVQRLVESTPAEAEFKKERRIRVKLASDGTTIGK